MAFAIKFMQNTARSLSGLNLSRSFHMLMRPTAVDSCRSNNIIGLQQQLTTINTQQGFLAPVTSIIQQVAGFKVKGRLKRRCKDCYIVKRQERGYVICPTHPRHKQMAMKKRDYKSWILTHATQSKERGY